MATSLGLGMKVSIRLFAALRERLGQSQVELDLPEGASVREALLEIEACFPGGHLFSPQDRVAVNREYAGLATRLREGDEIAVIPPISGG